MPRPVKGNHDGAVVSGFFISGIHSHHSIVDSRQSALADGLYGLNSRNTEPRCDPHLLVEQSNGINKTSAMTIPRPAMVDRLKDD